MTKPNTTASYEINQRAMRDSENKLAADRRKVISASGGNCLMCKHTKTALGKRLVCRLKDKLVTQYNYCDKFIELRSEPEGDDNP